MSIQRNDSLFFAAPKSGDSRYDNDGAGYADVAAVNTAIIASYRYRGLTVNIQGVEYWYDAGTGDGDLVVKNPGNEIQNVSDDSGNSILIGSNVAGGINITGNSSDTNADITMVLQGTGTFKLGGAHEANISDNNDVITKGYADANYSSAASAAGSNTQIQFNNTGAFGASGNLTFASNTLTVNGTNVADGLIELTNSSANAILANDLNSFAVLGVGSSQAFNFSDGAYFKADGSTLSGNATVAAGDGGYITIMTSDTERLRILDDGTANVLGVWNFQSNAITNVADPSSAQDVATKNYVDGLITGFEQTANKGVANGYTPLDANSKVPVQYLPNSIMEYQGNWDASINDPTLADGGGNTDDQIGNVYLVSVAGTQDLGSGSLSFNVGDFVILNAQKIWEKSLASGTAVGSANKVQTTDGSGNLTESDLIFNNGNNTLQLTGGGTFTVNSGSGELTLSTNSNNNINLNPGTGSVLIPDGSTSNPSIAFTSNTDVGFILSGGALQTVVDGTAIASVDTGSLRVFGTYRRSTGEVFMDTSGNLFSISLAAGSGADIIDVNYNGITKRQVESGDDFLITGEVETANDSGSNPVTQFQSNLNGAGVLATRPLFGFYNYTTLVANVSAGGDWDFQGNDLTNMNSLYLSEIAAAGADTAGRGQVWVRNDTPNVLVFTDDAGTDYDIAGSGVSSGGATEAGTGTDSIQSTVGTAGDASGNDSISIGSGSEANGTDMVAIGHNAGSSSGTIQNESVSIGPDANAGTSTVGARSVAVGHLAESIGIGAVAIGDDATSSAAGGVSIGDASRASQAYGIAIGDNSDSTATGAIAIGRHMTASAQGAIMLGYRGTSQIINDREDSFAVGWDDDIPSMWIERYTGTTTDATANVVIGSISLDADSVYMVEVSIIGGQTDALATEFAGYKIIGTFQTISGGVAASVGTTTVSSHETTGSMDANLNPSGGSVQIRVTGVAASNMNWRALVQLTKVDLS